MTAAQPVIPAWIVPADYAVKDLLVIAAAYPHDVWAQGCYDAVDWITGWPSVTHQQAVNEMDESTRERADKHRAAVADTIAWLVGLTSYPPIRLPKRNPDSTLVTAQQHYERALADEHKPTPERREEAWRQAEQEYVRSARLADLG